MKRLISGLLLSGLLSLAMADDATSAVPLRVGPVSNYGVLGTSGSSVISLKTNKPVMLKGMSLFWSDAVGSPYYNENVIAWAAKKLQMQVFRFAMGIESYDSDGGNSTAGKILESYAYKTSSEAKIAQLDRMVKAAIENDIYIIVDWHSHRAESEQTIAVDFFTKMATKYKDVPNIIWEVYNEPVNTNASTIANYANTVISGIRNAGSSNLALVGTPFYSQMGSGCGTVNQTNVAYVLHFYAASHSLGSFKSRIESCMDKNAVFISEWGVTAADGSGAVNTSAASEWTSYMDSKRISNCNWSLRHSTYGEEVENSAMFSGSEVLNNSTLLDAATYTESGTFVKNYLTKDKVSWPDTLTAGARSGSCAFSHVTVTEEDGSKSGVGKSGCTYTSSNENVATMGTDGTVTIKAAGFAVMTGNDGTQSVVTVEAMPEQTVSGLNSKSCTYKDLQKAGTCTNNYTGNSSYEYQLTVMTQSAEGGAITCTSDNPDVVKIEKLVCNTSQCYSHKGEYQWIATFTGKIGVANIHVTVDAVPGYKAMDQVVTIALTKTPNTINPAVFRDVQVAYNSTTELFPATSHQVPVTYTLSSEEYGTIDGTNFVAGSQDATIQVHATGPEAETYMAIDQVITITIGNGGQIIESIAPQTLRNAAVQGRIQNDNLIVNAARSGFAKVQIYDVNGKGLVREEVHYLSAGTNTLSLKGVAHGMYFVRVKQSSVSTTIPWSNK